jgi:hypothetical protein
MKRLLFGTSLAAAILPIPITASKKIAMKRAARLIVLAVVALLASILASTGASGATTGSCVAYPG